MAGARGRSACSIPRRGECRPRRRQSTTSAHRTRHVHVAARATVTSGSPRALVVRAGPEGRRHLRGLVALGVDAKVLPIAGAGAEAAAWQPSAVIVESPTPRHVGVALRVCPVGGHLLIEPSVADAPDGLVALRAVVRARSLTTLSGARLRYHPTLAVVRHWIAEGRIGAPLSAQARWSARPPAGPDAGARTLQASIDALRWILGEVETIAAVAEPAIVMLAFAGGALGTTTRDPLLPPASHVLNVMGDAGTVHWDLRDGVARLSSPRDAVWMRVAPRTGVEREALRLAEVRHLLECVHGRARPRSTLDDGIRATELTQAVLRPHDLDPRRHV